MNILGIETSCDETAAAVVADGHRILSNVISSQVGKHAPYGGVIPELAAREHLGAIQRIVDAALAESGTSVKEIDGVAVTASPGLLPALLVGIAYAKGISAALDIPLIGIDHFLAHIFGAFIHHPKVIHDPETFPILSLVVSGGHTALVIINRDGSCRIIGQTLDDAAGEAFDKAAKILHLGYPGGPILDRLATSGDPKRYKFPRGLTGKAGTPVTEENRFNFSFSGVKTALVYHLRDHLYVADAKEMTEILSSSDSSNSGNGDDSSSKQDVLDTIASYQEAIVDVLVTKTIDAMEAMGARAVVLCGGVACNSRLRTHLTEMVHSRNIPLYIADPEFCTDNAAMIAGLGYYQLQAGNRSSIDLDASPKLQFEGHAPFVRN